MGDYNLVSLKSPSILSLVLFNVCLSELFFILEGFGIASYADDNVIFSTGESIEDLIPSLISYIASLRIQSEYGKLRIRETPNKDNFYAVLVIEMYKIKNGFSSSITSNICFRINVTHTVLK